VSEKEQYFVLLKVVNHRALRGQILKQGKGEKSVPEFPTFFPTSSQFNQDKKWPKAKKSPLQTFFHNNNNFFATKSINGY
jgi:hypothetical protein